MSDKNAKLLSLFNLPSSTGPPVNSFNCAYLDGNIPYQGTLYLFNTVLAFYSSLVPLHTQKLVVPYTDITSLTPARLMGMNRSMALGTADKEYFFTSFLSRDKCIASIEQLMKRSSTARRRGGSREGDEREDDEGQGEAEGDVNGEAGDEDGDGDAEQAASKRRPKRLGVEEDGEESISFVSEADEEDDEPTSGSVRPHAVKANKSARPNKANHRRALSTNYTAGERYTAAKDKSVTAEDSGGLSKQERLLARNAQRIKEQKERAEKEKVDAAMDELRDKEKKEKEKARGAMIARLSPMNLIKSREQREEEEKRRKRREDRQEWEHNTDSDPETSPDGEQEKGRRRGKVTKQPIRLPRKRDGEDEDNNTNRGSTSPSVSADERIDDESSPSYIPPQPSSLYMPSAYTLADPQVTAIAARFSSLSGPLDTKNRRYIADGPVQRQGRYTVVSRHMFLFTDKLILAKVKGNGRLQMKQQCDLDTVTLDIRPVDKQWKECRETKLPEPFRICFVDKKGKGWWVVSASEGGVERRRQWVKQIQLAVSRLLWVRWKEEGRQFEWGWYMKLVEGSIHLAVRNNQQEEVKEMLTREPAVVNERGQQGLSPLMVAAHVNHHQIASLLLSHDALPTYRDWDGRTAVHIAAKLGYADTLTVLLEDERVECELYHPGKGRFSTNSALWMAALSHRGEYDKCMRMLVERCKEHQWPSSSASSLLDQRDIEQHTLLETCVSLSLTDIIPIVLSLGASLDLPHPTLRLTPLCLAAQQTDMESLTTLIQLGAQPNWRDSKSGNAALHHASSLQVASFLVAHGARISMRNKEGTRVTDIYSQSREVQTLMAAEQLYQQRKPVDTKQPIKGRPRSVSANGGHALDSCYLCGDGVGGLGGVVMMKKVGWCARCGYVMCAACLSQELIFVDDEGEAEMRVCSGCYNTEMYAEETADRKKRRLERQRKEAEEAKQSIFNLDYITAALTAVHISQHALPGNMVSTYHGKVQIAELPAVTSSSPISAPVAAVDPLAAPVASRRSPQPSSATSNSPPPRKQLSVIGPGANATLASVDRVVNYAAGGSTTPRAAAVAVGAGRAGRGEAARRVSRLSVNNESPAADESNSGGKRAVGGMKVSASMDGVSDRMKKGQKCTAASKGKARNGQRADEQESVEAEQSTDESFVLVEDADHEPDSGRRGAVQAAGKGKAAVAPKKGVRGGGKEERKQQQQSDEGEEEEEQVRVVDKKGAKRAGKTVLEVRVDDEEKRNSKKPSNEVVKKATKQRVVEDDFT